ncbi:MAG: hypothetical protein N2512_14835 [Armatimonadetes bacterium]|nr:hypothetical protein [Armatimonadota bacterium]
MALAETVLSLGFSVCVVAQALDGPLKPHDLMRMPAPPYVVWYQCPFMEDMKYCNLDASVGSHEWAVANHKLGICSLMWTYGPNSPYAEGPDYFIGQYTSPLEQGYVGCAVDEWNVGDDDPKTDWCAAGLREARKRFPEAVLAVWVTHPTPKFRELVRDGTVDLALIEGYTFVPDHPEWAISWDGLIRDRVELMKREGLLQKTIVCVGMVAARPDKHGECMTPEELTRQVVYLATHYPEMPGIAFYGWRDEYPATRALVRLADALAGIYFVEKAHTSKK